MMILDLGIIMCHGFRVYVWVWWY